MPDPTATVVWSGRTFDLVERTPPVVVPPVVTPPAAGRLNLGLWHHGWEGPALDQLPADVRAKIRRVSLAMGQSGSKGTGQITTPPGAPAAAVRSLRKDGVDVFVGVGGSNDGGIAITSSAQASQAKASLLSMRDQLGVNGVDLDLEASGSNWTAPAIVELGHALAAAGMLVKVTSSLYAPWTERWGAVCRQLAGDGILACWSVMAYDYPEAGDSRHRAMTLGKVGMMLGYVPVGRVVVAYMPRPNPAYVNASPVPVLLDAAAAVKAAHPEVGAEVWEDLIDGRQAWAAMRGLVGVLAG